MPYIANEDRPLIDLEVQNVADEIVQFSVTPIQVFDRFYKAMRDACMIIDACQNGFGITIPSVAKRLGRTIFDMARKYNYDGAWLGGLNYATTRLIQIIPKIIVEKNMITEEFRYWYYAEVVGYLGALVKFYQDVDNTDWINQGFAGVFEDVKDEYKRRVNVSYEAYQNIKTGDCYDSPYYTRLIEVKDQLGNPIGYQEIMVKRSLITDKNMIGEITFKRYI
jgi:hypothetical protein